MDSKKYTTIIDIAGNKHKVNKDSIWYVISGSEKVNTSDFTPHKVILGRDCKSSKKGVMPTEIGFILTHQKPYFGKGKNKDRILFNQED